MTWMKYSVQSSFILHMHRNVVKNGPIILDYKCNNGYHIMQFILYRRYVLRYAEHHNNIICIQEKMKHTLASVPHRDSFRRKLMETLLISFKSNKFCHI